MEILTDTDELARAAARVEDMIRAQGIDPEAVRMEPPGQGYAWSLLRGSAAVAVFLRPARDGEEGPRLRVVSPIVKCDEGVRPELYKTLLELNASGLGGMSFGLHQDRVVVVAERRAVDLDDDAVRYLIDRVGVVADHYDDQLIARFGGVRVSDLP